ncbi:hypothetical protein PENTCL1PPCAC_9820, partial [Pristionchus entomophagus]
IDITNVEKFQLRLSIVLSVLLCLAVVASVMSYFYFPKAMLTCKIIASVLSVLHFFSIYAYDEEVRKKSFQIFQSHIMGISSMVIIILSISLVCFCFTLNWAAAIAPTELLIYACAVLGVFTKKILGDSKAGTASIFMLFIVVGCVCAFGLAFFVLDSLLLTFVFATIAVMLPWVIVKSEYRLAKRQHRSYLPVTIIADVAATFGVAAVVGAAREAAVHPYLWEFVGAAVFMIAIMPECIDSIGQYRETDPHFGQRNPITTRVFLKGFTLLSVTMLMIASIAGSYFIRDHFPTTVSPMHLITCILLFVILFMLDNLRHNVS